MEGNPCSDSYSGGYTACKSIPSTGRQTLQPNPALRGISSSFPKPRRAVRSGPAFRACVLRPPPGRGWRTPAPFAPPSAAGGATAPAQEGGGWSKMAARVLLRWSPAGAGAVPRIPPGGGLALRWALSGRTRAAEGSWGRRERERPLTRGSPPDTHKHIADPLSRLEMAPLSRRGWRAGAGPTAFRGAGSAAAGASLKVTGTEAGPRVRPGVGIAGVHPIANRNRGRQGGGASPVRLPSRTAAARAQRSQRPGFMAPPRGARRASSVSAAGWGGARCCLSVGTGGAARGISAAGGFVKQMHALDVHGLNFSRLWRLYRAQVKNCPLQTSCFSFSSRQTLITTESKYLTWYLPLYPVYTVC